MVEVRKEVIDWFSQAEEDLTTAEILFKAERFYACAFYCQQAVEKALKALYLKQFRKNTPSHNLVELARELKAEEAILKACRLINPHYAVSRYPDAANAVPADVYTESSAENLLEEARRVLKWAEPQTMR